jgi:hypothetical protein
MATTVTSPLTGVPAGKLSVVDAQKRLVWANYKGILWPAMHFHTLDEYSNVVAQELDRKGDNATKTKLSLEVIAEALGKESLQQGKAIVRYLGRPIGDYQRVKDYTYHEFLGQLPRVMKQIATNPEAFGPDQHDLYMDFHRGFDKAHAILMGIPDSNDSDGPGVWARKAKNAWDVAPQLHDHRCHQENLHINSPLNSVAAVSLAEESYVSAAATATSTPPQDEAPGVLSPPPLEDSLSPLRNSKTWQDVWCKLSFSGWTYHVTHQGIKIFRSPEPHNSEFNEEEVKAYAQTRYGWNGGARVTRNSINHTNNDDAKRKEISFGVLWKSHLKPNGWDCVVSNRRKHPFSNWYYVKPGKTVADGVEGQDFFATKDQVLNYCHQHQDYPSSSSSEGEISSPEATSLSKRNTPNTHNGESSEDDDESTKIPLETEDESSINHNPKTPRGQATRPQDPQMLRAEDSINTISSAESSVEDDHARYSWFNLWARLKHLGWDHVNAHNNLDNWWYLPPRNLEKRPDNYKEWVEGTDYFCNEESVINYCRRIDGRSVQEEGDLTRRRHSRRAAVASKDTSSRDTSRPRPTKGGRTTESGSHKKAGSVVTKDKAQTKISSKKLQSDLSKGKKRNLQNAKEIKKSKAKKQKQRKVPAKDISVECNDNDNQAPWVISPFPTQLHRLVVGAGANYKGCYYYLPNEGPKSHIVKFVSPNAIIEYCGTHGGLDVKLLSDKDRTSLKRLLAYANVPLPMSVWRTILSISMEETKLFLGVLGYTESLSDGSWKVPEGMSQVLFKETFPSLSTLIEALRRAPELLASNGKRRRGSSTELLSKTQMLALRLRIAEGLDEESRTAEEGEMSGETSDNGSENTEELQTDDSEESEEESKETEGEEGEDTDEEISEPEPTREDKSVDGKSRHVENEVQNIDLEIGVSTLLDSICTDAEGWKYLKRLGCKYSKNYATAKPRGKERFDSLKDLVHHILTHSIMELDFETNRLPKAELQRFHRWLKYFCVRPKLTSWEVVGEALYYTGNSEEILRLLAKIGIKQEGASFRLENGDASIASLDLQQVVNMIRAHREDLMKIGQDGSVRYRRRSDEKESLPTREDLTLRLFAAGSELPVLFFDEDGFSAEAYEGNEEAEIENEANIDVQDNGQYASVEAPVDIQTVSASSQAGDSKKDGESNPEVDFEKADAPFTQPVDTEDSEETDTVARNSSIEIDELSKQYGTENQVCHLMTQPVQDDAEYSDDEEENLSPRSLFHKVKHGESLDSEHRKRSIDSEGYLKGGENTQRENESSDYSPEDAYETPYNFQHDGDEDMTPVREMDMLLKDINGQCSLQLYNDLSLSQEYQEGPLMTQMMTQDESHH